MPPEVEFIQLPVGARRIEVIGERVSAFLSDAGMNLNAQILYLAESEFRATFVRRQLLERVPALPGGVWGTLDSAAEQLYRSRKTDRALCDSLLADALIRNILAKNDGTGSRPSRGMTRLVGQALTRLRVAAPPSERLELLDQLVYAAGREDQKSLVRRLKLIAEVSQAFDVELESRGLVSPDDIEWMVAEKPELFLQDFDYVVIDDLYRFGPAQKAFLRACLKTIPKALILTRSLNDAGDPSAYLQGVVEFFAQFAAPQKAKVQEQAMDSLEFASSSAASSGPRQLFVADSPLQEARFVAREVKQLHGEGVALDAIAIGCVNHAQGEELTRELRRLGIPVRRHISRSLVEVPAIAAVLALIRTVVEGGEREALFGALRSPYLHSFVEEFAGERSPSDWLSRVALLSRHARLIGADRAENFAFSWRSSIDGFLGSLNSGELDDLRIKVEAADEAILKSAIKLIDCLDGFTYRSSLSEFAGKLLHFCQNWKVADDVKARVSDEYDHPKAFAKFMELLSGIERFASLGLDAEVPSLQLFYDLLDEFSERLAPANSLGSGIFLGGLLDLRGLESEYLFITGLEDGVFPFPDPENLFLPAQLEHLRSEVPPDKLMTLTGDVNPLEVYRLLFDSIIGAPTRRTYLSYAKSRDEVEQVPAIPLADYLAAKEITLQELDAQKGRIEGCLSTVDLQVALSSTLGASQQEGDAVLTSDLAIWLSPALRGNAVTYARDEVGVLHSLFEGTLDSGVAERVRDEHLFRRASSTANLSPSRLECAAQCGLKYILRYLVGAQEPLRPDLSEDARERGELLHQTLEKFLRGVQEDLQSAGVGRSLHPLPEGGELVNALRARVVANLDEFESTTGTRAADRLIEVFRGEVDALEVGADSFHAWAERNVRSLEAFDLESENAELETELSAFLRYEFQNQRKGLFPWLMELHFDDRYEDAAPSAKIGNQSNPERLATTGFIDRVDLLFDGDEPSALVIRDYKSSPSNHHKKLEAGLAFQLPLYALAASQIAPDLPVSGFFYYPLKDFTKFGATGVHADNNLKARFFKGKPKIKNPEEALGTTLPNRINSVIDAIEGGQLPPTLVMAGQGCSYCDYRMACGVRLTKQAIHEQVYPSVFAESEALHAYFPALLGQSGDDSSEGEAQ